MQKFIKYIITRLFILIIIDITGNFAFASYFPDTVHIEEINIIEKKNPELIGFKYTIIDSVYLAQNTTTNLSELLAISSPVFIKSYGTGNIATSSFRGAGASHTQVLWNGVNINSPMLGQVDFSLIPNSFIDNIILYHGGASDASNNGAIGGSIYFNNKPDWNNKRKVSFIQSVGSYNNYNSFLSFGIGNSKFQSNTRIIYANSKNNYKYKLPSYSENELYERIYAEYIQSGIIQEFYFRINDNNLISFNSWIQKNNNNIPPTANKTSDDINENYNVSQTNKTIRNILSWDNFGEKLTTKYSFAYIYDFLNYTNDDISVNSNSTVNSYTNSVNINYKIRKNLKLKSGITSAYHIVNSTEYNDIKNRSDNALSLSLNGEISNRFKYLLSVKQEYTDKNFSPLIPSIGIKWKPIKKKEFILKSSFYKNYHNPNLNDLYWPNDGYTKGNPDLQHETGYSFETGILISNKEKDFKYNIEFTGYYSEISNWIYWHINNLIWQPDNLKTVERKGIESSTKLSYKLNKILLTFFLNYNLTDAENKEAISPLDNSAGKQLIYVPRHNFNSGFKIDRNEYYLLISDNYYSKRYTSTDNTAYLDDINIVYFKIGKKIKLKNSNFDIQFNIDNLLNIDYQIISGKPMPKRLFFFTIKYSLKN
ncbi:MAG: TonB-dependent receptor plug domain-containing protein [Bacteroidales bacterium]|nr:TonB-dependent receptor plug domain-containing protein [Bacteroidales bacterium]